MSKERFTPGPWSACKIKHCHPQLIGETCCVKIGENVIELDYKGFGHENNDYEQSEANAALIAAAPEMYDILEHYLNLIQAASEGAAIAEQKIFEDIVDIERVLKKARGEKCGNAT